MESLSIDSLLTKYAKHIKPGETITFNLIKGGTSTSVDPVDPKAPPVEFPLIAKFGVSVEKPNFATAHRMYEQKVPEAKDDSDDEEHFADSAAAYTARKKRRRRSRPDRRQWILEPETEFMESLGLVRQQNGGKNKLKVRYEGVAEANWSSYVLLSVPPGAVSASANAGSSATPQLNLNVTPVQGFQSFQQPSKVHTLSMQEAEDMIGDQRVQMTRFMMHAKASAAGATTPVTTGRGSALKGAPIALSRARLLGKLTKVAAGDDDDDDDVMADLKFSNRKKGIRARQELLASLGDGLTVDDDGVLGGANDMEFAGKRSFGRVAQATKAAVEDDEVHLGKGRANNDEDKKSSGAATFDGMAMTDDFYQRDVQAEYEDLDYDANDQFDDDDVDQTEEVDISGVVGDDEEEESDEEEEEEGVSGLATVAGLKALMAKARGESQEEAAPGSGAIDSKGKKTTAYNREDTSAAGAAASAASADGANFTSDQSSDEEKPRKRPRVGQQPPAAVSTVDPLAVDETGQRVISLEAIRREIWLHHGQIKTKTLVKIFNVKRRSAEHKKVFGDLVKELCTMTQTVEGNLLVLKQHYAK